ncbi:hypothetical protein BDF19DRAFT_448695 [Syncephalis fuscata]|nr:hypothetical protein BDF19DRAFT_448695 [Syncephalis fuscata]
MTVETNVDSAQTSLASNARVAVVGSGITGLAAAWLLKTHSPHQVVLYEAADRLGGHANTVDYTPPSAALKTYDAPENAGELESCPVDTGFIVYNRVTYPNMIRLFAHLQVPVRNSDMSFAVSRNCGELEWSGTNAGTVFCQSRNLVLPESEKQMGIGDWLGLRGYSNGFIDDYLMPMTASVWSTPADVCAKDFPAWTLARFLHNHRLLQLLDRPQWMTVAGGSREYVQRISADLDEVHLNCAVESVQRTDDGRVLVTDSQGRQAYYDHSLRILGESATGAERKELKNFRFERNRAVLHCDQDLMPTRVNAWSAWNYLSLDVGKTDTVMSLTYWMNRLQSLDPAKHGQIFVTVNPPHEPREGTVSGEWDYEHPVYTIESVAAQKRLRNLPYDRISFCGAWSGYGFHEDGLRSGMAAAEALGAKSPFGLHDAEYDDYWSSSIVWVILSWIWILFDFLLRIIPSTLISLVGFGNSYQVRNSRLAENKTD